MIKNGSSLLFTILVVAVAFVFWNNNYNQDNMSSRFSDYEWHKKRAD